MTEVLQSKGFKAQTSKNALLLKHAAINGRCREKSTDFLRETDYKSIA